MSHEKCQGPTGIDDVDGHDLEPQLQSMSRFSQPPSI